MFYSFPENSLNSLEEENVAQSMTQVYKETYNEKFFIHQSSLISSLNYYFEIHSDWARGNKEMLLVSVILDRYINQANEEKIHSLCIDLESQFNSNKEIFKALYLNEMDSFEDEEHANIKRVHEGLIVNIKDFYNKIGVLLKIEFIVSLEIEKKLDLNLIAKEIEGIEFNPEKFPGLFMKIEKPSAKIIIFPKGKMVIKDMKKPSEVKQVVDIVLKKIQNLGINISNPKIMSNPKNKTKKK